MPWEPLETKLPEASEAISKVIPGRCEVDCPSADEGDMLCSRNSMGKGPNIGESIKGVGNRERMAVREEVAEAREGTGDPEMGMKESGLYSRAVFSTRGAGEFCRGQGRRPSCALWHVQQCLRLIPPGASSISPVNTI